MTPTTPDQELRAMIGDLLMQIAMLRAENANLKAEQRQPNGHDREAADDYRPQPG
jgi:uncharacterized small protein (DUF1192 family)